MHVYPNNQLLTHLRLSSHFYIYGNLVISNMAMLFAAMHWQSIIVFTFLFWCFNFPLCSCNVLQLMLAYFLRSFFCLAPHITCTMTTLLFFELLQDLDNCLLAIPSVFSGYLQYWVSQGKKWCDFCKIFIANNPLSIRTHDLGQRHKDNVTKRLASMRKESKAREKEQKDAASALEQIEEVCIYN